MHLSGNELKISRLKAERFPHFPEIITVKSWVYFLPVLFLCHLLTLGFAPSHFSSFWLNTSSVFSGATSASLTEKVVEMSPGIELLTLPCVWGRLGIEPRS